MASVGRVAELGELYDARSDRFLHMSLFKSKLNKTISTQNRETNLQLLLSNSYKDKFNSLDISGELKLSILGGLFKLSGSGTYFTDTKKSSRSAEASLIDSFSTEYEKISITDSTVQPLINLDVLQQIDATQSWSIIDQTNPL